MWSITNNLNHDFLNRYADLITNFFNLVIKLSELDSIEEKLEEKDFLEEKFDDDDLLDKRLLKINKSAKNQFKPLVKSIIKLGPTLLKEEFDKYKLQNEFISNLNYNILQSNHPEPLKKVFKDYFYDKFFGIDWIWTDLVGKSFNRKKYKTNFKEENKLYVCPYCDSDTISNTRNGWIEHFLPKGKFPYISCNSKNLIPSCTSCNVSGSGKGEDVKNPILTQHHLQIGDNIDFRYEKGKIIIEQHNNEAIENYIKLLKLRNRYNEVSVQSNVISTLKVNYNIFESLKKTNEFDKEIFFEFIHNIGRNRGYYFVQKNLLKFIDEF